MDRLHAGAWGQTGDRLRFDGKTVWLDEHQVTRVDPRTGKVAARLPTGGGTSVAFDRGQAWLAVEFGGLQDTDLASNKALRTLDIGLKPSDVIVVDGVLWVTEYAGGNLWRLVP